MIGGGKRIATDESTDRLYHYISRTMPFDEPGTLTQEQYWNVIGYLLKENELLPDEDTVLGPDTESIELKRAKAMSGHVVAIYTAGAAGEPMQARAYVRAVPGRGLEGDRYFSGAGAYSGTAVAGREVTELTLIEEEVIEHLQHDLGLSVSAPDSRRNIVTRSLSLNELVGADFWVGPVLLHGAGLCEPCVSLVRSPENKHLLRGLVHKGGLRAQILSEGVITIGDAAGALAVRRLAAVG